MLFTRTLKRSTSVSSACPVWVDGTQWMVVCRPQGYLELWHEADGRLAACGGVEMGEVVQVVPLPPKLPGFLAIDVIDRVTLVRLLPGESPQSMPQVVECGNLDLAAETAQQAARRRVGGAVCSRCIRLHLTQGAELLKLMPRGEHFDEFMERVQHGDKQAGAAGAAELATAADAGAEAARVAEQAAAEAEAARAADRTAAAADAAAARAMEQAAAGEGSGQPSLRSHPLSDVGSDSGSDTEAASGASRASAMDAGGAAAAAAAGRAAAAAAANAADRMPTVAGYVTAMCLRQGYIHFVEVVAEPGKLGNAALAVHGVHIPPLPDNHLGGGNGEHDEMVGLELLWRKEKGTRIVVDLVLLCSAAGSRARVGRPQRYLRLARMRFDIQGPLVGPGINWIAEAPFYNRRVEPTASLLHAADGNLLTLGQRQVLIHMRGLLGELACELPAPPVAAVELSHKLHVIADASGGLSLLDTSSSQPSWRCRPIECTSQLSVATTLCFVPSSDSSKSTVAGWLFVGSHNGDSQLLAIPVQLVQDVIEGTPISDVALRWQVLAPHTIENLAPINDQLTFEHPAGSGEQRLALCCGAEPTGTLRVAGMGVGLTAWAQVELGVQGRPQLWAVDGAVEHAPGCGRASQFLVLSSELAGATSLLEIRGDEVQPTNDSGGLRLDMASLLIASMPELVMVQVTAQSVRTMPTPGITGGTEEWAPPLGGGAITVAVSSGHSVIVACSSQVHHLEVSPPSPSQQPCGKIRHVSSAGISNQVASLAIREAGPAGGSTSTGKPPMYAVIGTWVSNEVLVWPLHSDITTQRASPAVASANTQQTATAKLSPLLQLPYGTPRSLLVHCYGPDSTPFLFLGTSSGEVVFCPVRSVAGGALQLGAGRTVQVGLAEVRLLSMPAGVLAISDQALLLRQGMHHDPSGVTGEAVDAQRVHESDSVTAAAAWGSTDVPNGLVWLTGDGELSLGELDTEVRLRWSTARLGDTPLHMGLLPASGTLLAATRSQDGAHWLRLMHCTSLQQLVEVQLRKGQEHSALHAGRVPLAVAAASSAKGQKRKHTDTRDGAAAAAAAAPDAAACPVADALDVAVVAHHEPTPLLEQAAAAGRGRATHILSARLSFFTVRHRPSEDAAKDEYQLQLLGSHRLPSVCHAMTLLRPGGSADTCQLVAACHSGVQVYSLRVSTSTRVDAAAYGISLQHLYQMGGANCVALLRPVGSDELAAGPLLGSLLVCGPDTGGAGHPAAPGGGPASAATAACAASRGHRSSDGRQDTADGGVAPGETAGEVQAAQRLRVRSANIGSLYVLDFVALSGDQFLVAAHPSGILLLRRFRDLEAEAEAAAAVHRQRTAEASRQRDAAGADEAAVPPEALQGSVPLGIGAACRLQHSIVGLLPGRLGVPHSPLPASCFPQQLSDANAHEASKGPDSNESSPLADADCHRDSALFVTRDGGVGIIQTVSQGELTLLQEAQDVARSLHSSRRDCTGARTHEVVRTLESYAADANGEPLVPPPSNTVAGDLVAAMLDADPGTLQAYKHSGYPASAKGVRVARLVQQLSLGTCGRLQQ